MGVIIISFGWDVLVRKQLKVLSLVTCLSVMWHKYCIALFPGFLCFNVQFVFTLLQQSWKEPFFSALPLSSILMHAS